MNKESAAKKAVSILTCCIGRYSITGQRQTAFIDNGLRNVAEPMKLSASDITFTRSKECNRELARARVYITAIVPLAGGPCAARLRERLTP
jgi:hypothetical protein